MRGQSSHIRSFPLLRVILARPRLFLSVLAGSVLAYLLPRSLVEQNLTRGIVGWNVGVWMYVGLALRMMMTSGEERMRVRAKIQDEGRILVLILAVLGSVASLVSTVHELSGVKDLHGSLRMLHIALTAFTILASWSFMHIMFALHYAHDFYRNRSHGRSGGLLFPGTETPNYLDFLYFAIVIGTSGQTADVSFASREMRCIGAMHCMLSFFYNTTVLALTINIGSSLV